MESLAIEKCHGTFEDSDYIPGVASGAIRRFGAREVTLNINYWLEADRT